VSPPLRLVSRAKVNLLLRVGGPEPDGYHPLLTVFAEVGPPPDLPPGEPRLEDELLLEFGGEGLELEVAGAPLGDPAENLVTRALARLGVPGARARLVKGVPHQAGLGGGSSDAAVALRAGWEALGRPGGEAGLREHARALGADVTFFLRGGYAIGRGRGDELEPIPSALRLPLLVVKPPEGVGTAEAYQALDAARPAPPPLDEGEAARWKAALGAPGTSPRDLADLLANDFHDLLVPARPGLRAVAEALVGAGALRALLCGSGAALFGLFADGASRDAACEGLRGRLPEAQVFRAEAGARGD